MITDPANMKLYVTCANCEQISDCGRLDGTAFKEESMLRAERATVLRFMYMSNIFLHKIRMEFFLK
jgi:hypothetical protein